MSFAKQYISSKFKLPASSEASLYLSLVVVLSTAYLTAGIALPFFEHAPGYRAMLFGFSQIRNPFVATAMIMAVALARLVNFPALNCNILASVYFRLGLALLSAGVFFALRTHFVNPDGQEFAYKFMTDIPWRGAHVTHDEMLELYVHSRFWVFTFENFHWNVEFSYQVLSCFAGGIFVFLLLTYCRMLFPDRAPLAFLLIVSGGYMQLFFGEIENYTLTATWVLGYFLASFLFLRNKVSVIVPSLLLAISLTFHLLSGFLIPSLAYLLVLAWKQGRTGEVLIAGGSFCLTVALTVLYFHLHGLPITQLWYSQAMGRGGHILQMLVNPSIAYYLGMANLAFLLVPSWVLIVPLLIYKRIQMDTINTHLVIASGFMTAFVLTWKAQLGIYNDWNLFAIAALPVSLLVWRNVLLLEVFKKDVWPVAALGLLFFTHSYSWVIRNHTM